MRILQNTTVWRPVVLLCAAGCAWAHAQSLPEGMRKQLEKAHIEPSSVSVWVSDTHRPDEPLLNWHSQTWRTPASVEKIYTTLAGLDVLGVDYRWVTRFYATQSPEEGTLKGPLYIRGGGDPKWTPERVIEAMRDLQALGIQRLDGDWVFDRSAFATSTRSLPALDGEVMRPYNAQPDALALNFKTVLVRLTPEPAKGHAVVSVDPPVQGLQWTQQVPLTHAPCTDWRSALGANLSNDRHWQFSGSYSARCGTQEWRLAFPNADQHALRTWQGLWQASEGQQWGTAREGRAPTQAQLLLSKASLPLGSIVEDINKFSNNLMAQHVWLTLDPAFENGGSATFEGARAAWVDWWLSRVHSPGMVPWIDNGSGLSRISRTTTRSLADTLQWAWRQTLAPVFVQSLPVVGTDGTARHWGQEGMMSCAVGKARVKTGSLRDVLSVAGYIPLQNGESRVFAAIINHENAAQGRLALRELVEWACQQPPSPTVSWP